MRGIESLPSVYFLKCLEYNADGVVAFTASGRVGGPNLLHSRLNIMRVIGARQVLFFFHCLVEVSVMLCAGMCCMSTPLCEPIWKIVKFEHVNSL